MKYAWSYAIAAIACTASLCAQTSIPKPPTPGSTARRFVVIGCLGREAQRSVANPGAAAPASFIITDTRGGHESTYRLDGDPKQLEIHVGHTLEIAGPISNGSSAGPGPNASAAVLKVESLTYISTRCQKSEDAAK